MIKTTEVFKTSFNGGVQEPRLNISEPHHASYNISSKSCNQEIAFSSPCPREYQSIPARLINLQSCNTDDNEISIFDAHKYFNEGNKQLQNHTIKSSSSPVSIAEQYNLTEFPRYLSMSSSSSVNTCDATNYGTRSFHATPTASSEASWNSQTGLLSNPPGTMKVSLRNPTPNVHDNRKKNSPRWFFRRNRPCIGKKSTQVDDKTVASKARSPIHFRSITPTTLSKQQDNKNIPKEKSPEYKTTTLNKGHDKQGPIRINKGAAGFSLPILNPSSKIPEELLRDSIEVFHPSIHENPNSKTTSTEKLIDDDAASDGSSDLFELDSFPTQSTTYQIYNNNRNNFRRESLYEAANFQNPRRLSIITATSAYRRNSLEETATASVASTEGYEPSEASINWSVTTAEGFDRASVATYDAVADRDGGGGQSGGRSGIRGNGLLGFGCGSENAVLVGPSPRGVALGFVSSVPVGSQHAGNWAYSKPPLGRPKQFTAMARH